MMRLFGFSVIAFFLQSHFAIGQESAWNLAELQDSVSIHPKKSIVFIHTDWCTYCKLQKRQLGKFEFGDDVYFAEFNGEQQEDVVFKNENYHFSSSGKGVGQHELVTAFADGKPVAYPMWVVLDEKLNVLDRFFGYLRPDELRELVKQLENHQ